MAEVWAEGEFIKEKQSAKTNAKPKAKIRYLKSSKYRTLKKNHNFGNKLEKFVKIFISEYLKLQYQQRPNIWKYGQKYIEEGHIQYGMQQNLHAIIPENVDFE